MTIEARRRIATFVGELRTDLEFLLFSPESVFWADIPPDEELPPAVFAEPELAEQLRHVWELAEIRFERLRQALQLEAHRIAIDARLEDHGLVGLELEAKLESYRILRRLQPPPDPRLLRREAVTPYRQRRRQQLRRWLKTQLRRLEKALKIANLILGSLGDAGVPAAGPVKEFKELVEASLAA